MKQIAITIPGGTTSYEDNPEITLIRNNLDRPDLSIRYSCSPLRDSPSGERVLDYGVLIFQSLLEYRWVDGDLYYDHFDDDPVDPFASYLVELLESSWIQTMSEKSSYLKAVISTPDRSRQLTIRHFRLWFDEYGTFDILARDFTSEEILDVPERSIDS